MGFLHRFTRKHKSSLGLKETGNVFLMLFGAVGMVGVVEQHAGAVGQHEDAARLVMRAPDLHVGGVGDVAGVDLVEDQEAGAIPLRKLLAHAGQPVATDFIQIHRVADGFEPQADTSFVYEPGNESRFRLALDKNVGETGKFTAGTTFQIYDTDQLDGRNLFSAGNRIRGDASYSFRTGSTTLNFFAADVYRSQGDLSLQIIQDNQVVGDTLVTTGSQNLAVLGITAAIPVGSTVYFRPTVDFRVQSVEEMTDEPSQGGWLLGAGGDLPLRLFGMMDFFPRGRFSFGRIKDATGVGRSFWGFEASATCRCR